MCAIKCICDISNRVNATIVCNYYFNSFVCARNFHHHFIMFWLRKNEKKALNACFSAITYSVSFRFVCIFQKESERQHMVKYWLSGGVFFLFSHFYQPQSSSHIVRIWRMTFWHSMKIYEFSIPFKCCRFENQTS